MDWFDLKALPIGLLMFGSLVWGVVRRRAGHRQAGLDFPALAVRLGLEYRAPSSSGRIGQLFGRLRGFAVFIDPDDQRKIIVRFRGEPRIDLRNYESPQRSNQLAYFASQHREVDQYFKTRFASPEVAERLQAADLPRLIAPFVGPFRYEVKQFNLTQHGVTCVLDFGNPPHIPATAVDVLLPVMLEWAEVIEPPDEPTDTGQAS